MVLFRVINSRYVWQHLDLSAIASLGRVHQLHGRVHVWLIGTPVRHWILMFCVYLTLNLTNSSVFWRQ